jgi:hypothetical protein
MMLVRRQLLTVLADCRCRTCPSLFDTNARAANATGTAAPATERGVTAAKDLKTLANIFRAIYPFFSPPNKLIE